MARTVGRLGMVLRFYKRIRLPRSRLHKRDVGSRRGYVWRTRSRELIVRYVSKSSNDRLDMSGGASFGAGAVQAGLTHLKGSARTAL